MTTAKATEKRTGVYSLEQFKLKNGTQLPRLHEYFANSYLPAAAKLHPGARIYLEALIAPHMPQVMTIQGFASLDEMIRAHAALAKDPGLQKAREALETGPEPAVETLDSAILDAAPYSPEIVASDRSGKPPRIFELRQYHSPTWRQLEALHARFTGPEIKIFHRAGIHPLFYSSTLIGPNQPNLTYLIPFDDLAAREKAWTTFGA
ncbi:MAG: NIPSNAP family protein, partial [Bryobacteraceae bacterium]